MNNYEDFKTLFSFLKFKNNLEKYQSDIIRWEIVEHVHNRVLATSKFTIQAVRFVALICDGLTTLDNQSWISIHGYCVEDWCKIPIPPFVECI